MTVPALPNYATFAGNGTTGPFTFNFPFFNDSDLSVFVTDNLGSTTAAQIAAITGAGSGGGGSITLTTNLPLGYTLRVNRVLQLSQQMSLPNGGPYFAKTIEAAFDYLTMVCQQLMTTTSAGIGSGSSVVVNIPADGTYTLPAFTSAMWGKLLINGGEANADFNVSSSGTVQLLSVDSSALVAVNTTAAGKLCLGGDTAANPVILTNRTDSTISVLLTVFYQ